MSRPTEGPRPSSSAQHERHLFANLVTQSIVHGSIKTTEARTRRPRPCIEKPITKDKRGDLHARRTMLKRVMGEYIVYRPFEEPAPKFEDREDGYTRIIKTIPRRGDNASVAVIFLVLKPVARKGIVEDAVTTAKGAAQRAVAGEGKAERKATTKRAEETDKADKVDKAEYVGAVRLEEGTTDALDDDHLVKSSEDSMRCHVSGSRWHDATVTEIWFADVEGVKVVDFAPTDSAAIQKVEK